MKVKIALGILCAFLAISVFANVYQVYGKHKVKISFEENEIIVRMNGQWYYADSYNESNDFIDIEF